MALVEPEPEPGLLANRFEILAGQPLQALRSPQAMAYGCIDRAHPDDRLFALICDPASLPRHDILDLLSGIEKPALLTPVAWDVVAWPAAQRRSFAIVFPCPGGTRVMASLTETIRPLSPDMLLRESLPPLVEALRALAMARLTHRAINPTTLFHRAATGAQLLLGDCVSAPAGATQPLVFETIESGMAVPAGRGAGTIADDLYALGVTLVVLLLGRDPTAALSATELLDAKMNQGSFATLTNGNRLPPESLELLRGLLADNPRDRWTLTELEGWLIGRRPSARQTGPVGRAARPFEIGGSGYDTARGLAHVFAREPAEAVRAIRDSRFGAWLQHSLAEPQRLRGVAMANALDTGSGGGKDARLVSRVAMALDPLAPIRYQSFAAAINGFGPALAAAFQPGGAVAPIAEALAARLPQFWLSVPGAPPQENGVLLSSFEKLRHIIDDRRPGFGIEHILYHLNPGLHCLAPLVEADYLCLPEEILPALESAVGGGRIAGTVLVDRHLAAFVAARFRGIGQEGFDKLASNDPMHRNLGALQLLARLQGSFGPAALPALARWFAPSFPALIGRFHNRPRRVRLLAEANALTARGDLAKLVALLVDGVELKRDVDEFVLAQRDVARVRRAQAGWRVSLGRRPREAAELGGRISIVVANLLAAVTALTIILLMG